MDILALPAFAKRIQNPYTWLLYSGMERWGITVHEFSRSRLLSAKYDLVHIHWPEWALRHKNFAATAIESSLFLSLLQQARLRGARVIWTVHNLQPHESQHPRLESRYWKLFPHLIDAYITLTTGAKQLVRDRFSTLVDRPTFVVPLGHYRDVYPNNVDARTARSVLGIAADARVISYVGRIRPYKNVPHLIRTFRAFADSRSVLLIAGSVRSGKLRDEVIMAAGSDTRVRLFLEFVPDEKIQLYLNAADLVVLPYTEILNSASALLALSFDRPTLLPNKGAMTELQATVGADWVKTYAGELEVETLQQALEWAQGSSRSESPSLERYEWQRLTWETVQAYRAVCSPETVARAFSGVPGEC